MVEGGQLQEVLALAEGRGALDSVQRRAAPGEASKTEADWSLPQLLSRSVSPSAGQTACNGHTEFCSRSYSNVSIIGAHNSYGVGAGNSE